MVVVVEAGGVAGAIAGSVVVAGAVVAAGGVVVVVVVVASSEPEQAVSAKRAEAHKARESFFISKNPSVRVTRTLNALGPFPFNPA